MAQVYQGGPFRRRGNGWNWSVGNWRIPKLYRLAEEGLWDEIPDRVRRHPREARFQLSELPNDTVLHRVVGPRLDWYFRAPPSPQRSNSNTSNSSNGDNSENDSTAMLLAAVHSLLLVYPAGIDTTNAYGQTPLHLACCGSQTSSRLAVAQLLVQHCPQAAARAEQTHGRTPLMMLILDNPWIVIEDESSKSTKRNKSSSNSKSSMTSIANQRLLQAARDLVESLCHADCMAWERPAHSGETALSMALSYCSSNSNSRGRPLRLATDWLYPLLQHNEEAWR